MRATSKLLALILAGALQPAVAGVVSVDFEDLTSFVQVGDRYAGKGLSFVGDAWGAVSGIQPCAGVARFTRDGSCGGLLLAQLPTDEPRTDKSSFTLNFAGGFVTNFSFVYSALADSDVLVELYDGRDGQGNLLAAVGDLDARNCANSAVQFCEWQNRSVGFAGTALSLRITGFDQTLMLDDLNFVTPTAGSDLPEPGGVALALSALGALGWARRRATR